MRGLAFAVIFVMAAINAATANDWQRAYSGPGAPYGGPITKGVVTVYVGRVKHITPEIVEYTLLLESTQPWKNQVERYDSLSWTQVEQTDCRNSNSRFVETVFWEFPGGKGKALKVDISKSEWYTPLYKQPDAHRYQKADVERSKIIPRMVCRK